jgi:hypothetical protein
MEGMGKNIYTAFYTSFLINANAFDNNAASDVKILLLKSDFNAL